MNPRDAVVAGSVRLHRMIRRGTAYGPPLPEGVLEDDGADRGLMFAFVGAHLGRQFEFVQSEWINDGEFLGAGDAEATRWSACSDGAGVHHPPAADPPTPARAARLRRHPRRRVLLHARPARAALARRPRHLSGTRDEIHATDPPRWAGPGPQVLGDLPIDPCPGPRRPDTP